MKVVVTGGTGFIGANVVRLLLKRGDEVTCLVRSSSPGLCLEGLPVTLNNTKLTDAEGLRRVLHGADEVYHLAGVFDPSPQGAALMAEVHVKATAALGEAALAAGVGRFVVCSSSITVGFGDRENPGDEDTPIADLDAVYGKTGPLRAYHDTKAEAEALAVQLAGRGLGAVIVNPDYIIGPWDIKPTSGALIVTMAKGWLPVYPRGGKCFQSAEDCALGHLLAAKHGQPGRRYLLGAHNLSYREFMGVVAEVLGVRPPVLPMPRRLGELAGLVGALGSRYDAHRFAGLDRYVLRAMAQTRYRSGRRAEDELGVPVSPIRDAVEAAVAWFRGQGMIP
ncbi:NAD-dependent epimerase/dehydratase family protein [Myxococcota bacterium]|nr:NAD-dependent epimerase/dehydratase family protein [Myxococcota bacterium]